MGTWTKIYFNAQNVEKETGRAVLINMPKKSGYAGFKFWHPTKLVRNEGGNGYHLSFSFTEDFNFKLFKNGNGKYNSFEVIEEIELSSSEIENAFNGGNEQISGSVEQENDSYLIVEEPEKVNKEVEEIEELKNELD